MKIRIFGGAAFQDFCFFLKSKVAQRLLEKAPWEGSSRGLLGKAPREGSLERLLEKAPWKGSSRPPGPPHTHTPRTPPGCLLGKGRERAFPATTIRHAKHASRDPFLKWHAKHASRAPILEGLGQILSDFILTVLIYFRHILCRSSVDFAKFHEIHYLTQPRLPLAHAGSADFPIVRCTRFQHLFIVSMAIKP